MQHIPRNENLEADVLAMTAASKKTLPSDVFYELITIPSFIVKRLNHIQREDWRAPLVSFIQGTFEQVFEIEHKRVAQRAKNYRLLKRELYKFGVPTPCLRCIPSEQGLKVLKSHSFRLMWISHRPTLAGKAIRQGLFWPTIVTDAERVAKTCEACQKNSNNQSTPAGITQLITPA